MSREDQHNNSRILLMSEDLAESKRLCAHLTLAGWHVIQALEQIEALSAVRNHNIDVALLHMPIDEMVDTDLPSVLRSVASSEYLPVMILTGSDKEQQRCRLLDSGADDVISTVTSRSEIVARIRSLLRVKILNDQLAASKSALDQSLQRERKLLAKLRRDNAHLQVMCTTDPLTHIQNVRSFKEMLQHEFRIAKRYNQHLSLLVLDVDHFKVVNDTYGHPSGDYVLKELAVILKQSVRESDVVARTGGEEFNVLLPKATRRKAASLAERIRKHVYGRKFTVHGQDIHITVSVGSATYPSDAEITEPEMLTYFADQALLEAKETGRDRVVEFRRLSDRLRRRLRRQYMQTADASSRTTEMVASAVD